MMVISERRGKEHTREFKPMMVIFEILGRKLLILSSFFILYTYFDKHSVVCTQY
jgi:hypothetical protein